MTGQLYLAYTHHYEHWEDKEVLLSFIPQNTQYEMRLFRQR